MTRKRKSVDTEKLRHVARIVSADLIREGIPHAIIGGLAVAEHGYVRATEDVDVLISEIDLGKLVGRPLTVGITQIVEGVRVDYIAAEAGDEALEEAIAEARGAIPIVGIPALVYLKLKLGRRRDQGDVAELVKRGRVHIRSVRKYLEELGDPDVLAEFEAIVYETEHEED
jgi:hypothetical protein